MEISSFIISQDRTKINITITDASIVSALRIWTDLTYKDYSKAIDLSLKLTSSATETIEVTLADLGLSYFDGVYFLEAEDPNEVSNAIESDLTRYKECILNTLIENSICEDCIKSKSSSLLNSHSLLTGLETAIEQGFINEMLILIKALNKYCSGECKTCGSRDNIIDSNYYSSNN